jgi:hypothetical protein
VQKEDARKKLSRHESNLILARVKAEGCARFAQSISLAIQFQKIGFI